MLDHLSPQWEQPSSIITPLVAHQKTSIYAMITRELQGETIGILADEVGAGKTLTILGFLGALKEYRQVLQKCIGDALAICDDIAGLITSYVWDPPQSQIDTTLIVVPHNIFFAWKETIIATYLSYICIGDKRGLAKDLDFSVDVVLVSAAQYPELIERTRGLGAWKRVIVDEIDSLRMDCFVDPRTHSFWGITSTPFALLTSACPGFIESLFQGLPRSKLRPLLVKNTHEHIATNFTIPMYEETVIHCSKPLELRLLQPFSHVTTIMPYMRASAMGEACKTLLGRIQRKLTIKNENVEFLGSLEFNLIELQLYDWALSSWKSGAVSKKRLIANLQDEHLCIHCLQTKHALSVLTCCQLPLCEACKPYLQFCPSCTGLSFDVVPMVDDESEENKDQTNVETVEPKYPTKHHALFQRLEQSPKAKILIFDPSNYSFLQIKKLLKSLKRTFREVKGNGVTIRKIVRDFNSDKTDILLLNTEHYGAGLNLQAADDLILFSELTPTAWTQVLGRGHRQGRKDPLHVYHLQWNNVT